MYQLLTTCVDQKRNGPLRRATGVQDAAIMVTWVFHPSLQIRLNIAGHELYQLGHEAYLQTTQRSVCVIVQDIGGYLSRITRTFESHEPTRGFRSYADGHSRSS